MSKADGIFNERVPFSWRALGNAVLRFDGAGIKQIVVGAKPTGWHMSMADTQTINRGNFDVSPEGIKAHKRTATSLPALDPEAEESKSETFKG